MTEKNVLLTLYLEKSKMNLNKVTSDKRFIVIITTFKIVTFYVSMQFKENLLLPTFFIRLPPEFLPVLGPLTL